MKRWQSLFAKQTYRPSVVDKWSKHDQKLFEAVEKGDTKKVSSILSKRFLRPTTPGPRGISSFHLAAARGLTDILNIIISYKVEVNAKSDEGCTALHLAASHCHPECVKLLLQRGAHEDSIDFHSRTPLHCAAASGCVSSARFLCDAEDCSLDAADDDSRTPLMTAAIRNHPTVCALLLERGAQIDLHDKDAKTALMLACERSNIQAAEVLITRGADLVLKDNRGFDAQHYANQSRDESLCRLVQATLDKRKIERGTGQENQHLAKGHHHVRGKEDEMVNIWKKRYEEEHKKGLWLQGDLMRKTHEIEELLEENHSEKRRMREMVEKLKDLLDGPSEDQNNTGDDFQTSDIFLSLSCAVEQIQAIKEQKLKAQDLQEKKLNSFADMTLEEKKFQESHQEAMRHLQDELIAANEREGVAQSRVAELEGHLENMRLMMSQFEMRKRIDSTVVEDLQEQINELTRERNELLKRFQKQEDNKSKTGELNDDQNTLQTDVRVLKEFLNSLKSDCIKVQTKAWDVHRRESLTGFVPVGVLEQSAESWKKISSAMETHLVNLVPSQSNLLVNGSVSEYKDAAPHLQSLPVVEACITCEQEELVNTCGNMNDLTREATKKNTETQKSIDALSRKVLDHEAMLDSLKLTNDRLLSQVMMANQEKQNLEEGLLTLQDRLQAEFVIKQNTEKKYKELVQQNLLLSDELLGEQEKVTRFRERLESLQSEMVMLRDSFPPEIVKEGSPKALEMFSSDVLEELYWNVGTLVRKYNEVENQKTMWQKEVQKLLDNQALSVSLTEHNNTLNEMKSKSETQKKETEELRQRLSQAMGSVVELKGQLDSQSIDFMSKEEHERQIFTLQREVTTLKEENEACQVALEGKCEEAIVLKQLLEQEVEERQVISSRETQESQEKERVRQSLDTQVQALHEEVQILSGKHNEASREVSNFRDTLALEREKVKNLEDRITQLEEEAEELGGKSQDYQDENILLTEKYNSLQQISLEKEKKVAELMTELESLTKEIVGQHKKSETLALQLEESNKQHQDIVNVYRAHLLNAAQGLMDEDVHLTLHWILKMQKEVVY
ncbi:ankyrin repeat domain-containing protein 35 isoform X1 [Xenopus laevis]|uniref:Ankyrin repeat domain-containing protein 35 isoform X1 n=1 Tax=Xenopus laevis TaxID=8355 RepID=A0A8J0TQP0_XENLA|nr:ankyrin repeat domain-containing protein 35 isoform X1 [Xenopus laevis]